MASIAFLTAVMNGGLVQPAMLSDRLGINSSQLAVMLGVSRDAISKRARLASPAVQAKLRDVAEIINRVLPWAGSEATAYAWYRSQPLPSFGDLTAQDLVSAGRAEAVKAYLSRIAAGGYA